MGERIRVGVVGARGYVGRELIAVLLRHPGFEIAFVSSSTQAGMPLREVVAGAPEALRFEALDEEAVAKKGADAIVLALPNDVSNAHVQAIEAARPDTLIVDLSADHRCDDAWVYGLPELFRDKIAGHRRIANPGCYATAAALSLAPVAAILDGPAQVFGVSGYSGAGTKPSPRNDVEALRDNIMPYSLMGHLHEREVQRHVAPMHLLPHVASFFRGITLTVSMRFNEPLTTAALRARYQDRYAGEPLIDFRDDIPLVRDIAGKYGVALGGVVADEAGRRGVVVATIDNLLKGAASQAVQNMNLAFGLPERVGIES